MSVQIQKETLRFALLLELLRFWPLSRPQLGGYRPLGLRRPQVTTYISSRRRVTETEGGGRGEGGGGGGEEGREVHLSGQSQETLCQ
ncbi:hypothetical protein CBR_g3651 [Chara braunii]|uniref:Uncharacterized protein n=1 Tax=Chara braunii TaxID=69332 RepID=A0A388KFX2_CHABU|nr:hypothetical protein CBR_g3651 [Chara braunii]|eukprot:GBG68952.1 hypothetical protein CBR_g3651 [Chara braunii]